LVAVLLDRWGGNIVYEWDIPADKVDFTSLADEENSLQCFDAVGWVAGRASGL